MDYAHSSRAPSNDKINLHTFSQTNCSVSRSTVAKVNVSEDRTRNREMTRCWTGVYKGSVGV